MPQLLARTGLLAAALALLCLLLAGVGSELAGAASRCFGERAKVLNQAKTYKLNRYDAVFINAPARILAPGDNKICSTRHGAVITLGKGRSNKLKLGSGNDRVTATAKSSLTQIDAGGGDNRITLNAKASKQVVKTGDGDDRIVVNRPAKASSRTLETGLGDDLVMIRAKGNTTATLSRPENPRGVSDNDTYRGGPSNDLVHDHHGSNLVVGAGGSDSLHSLGSADSVIHSGNGTDFIYSNGADTIYAGRGQDRIRANQDGHNGRGVFVIGGPGDDWIYGTPSDDILIAATGGDKLFGLGGDDLLRGDEGPDRLDGGEGTDTVSYATHTPPGYPGKSGVMVDLEKGIAHGDGYDRLAAVENVIGSSFDDLLTGERRTSNRIEAGLGNDEITAYAADRVDGGLGENRCSQTRDTVNCNERSPGPPSPRLPFVNYTPDGVMTVLGSSGPDRLSLGRDSRGYTVSAQATPQTQGCSATGGTAVCTGGAGALNSVIVYGNSGDDEITIENSVPADVYTRINAGDGDNLVRGGKTADYITTGRGQSRLYGGDGGDVITPSLNSPTQVFGGKGPDVLKVENACLGHRISGGPGKDNVVSARSSFGVIVNLAEGTLRRNGGGSCATTRLAPDIEDAEGSKYNDVFFGNRLRNGFLGRQGADVFNTRDGRPRDAIITGPGGRANKVTKDPGDKLTYGWGLAST